MSLSCRLPLSPYELLEQVRGYDGRTQSSRAQSRDPQPGRPERRLRLCNKKTGSHQEPVPYVRDSYLECLLLNDPETAPGAPQRGS